MLLIGLTGGISSGKTMVANYFQSLGTPIIDADEIAHSLTQANAPLTRVIIDHFGPVITTEDGILNRRKLREIIFRDKHEKTWLEQTLHPHIITEIHQRIASIKARYCIVVIPLLFEAQLETLFDRICVVDTTSALQQGRLHQRDQISEDLAANMLTSQLSREERLARADDIITNNGSLEALQTAVKNLHQYYLALSEKNQ